MAKYLSLLLCCLCLPLQAYAGEAKKTDDNNVSVTVTTENESELYHRKDAKPKIDRQRALEIGVGVAAGALLIDNAYDRGYHDGRDDEWDFHHRHHHW